MLFNRADVCIYLTRTRFRKKTASVLNCLTDVYIRSMSSAMKSKYFLRNSVIIDQYKLHLCPVM